MASKREQILAAVTAAVTAALSAERDADVPEAVSTRGLLIVRSAAAEIDDATIGGGDGGWYMRLDVPVEVYARTAQQLDDLVTAAATAIRGDAALFGLATYVEPTVAEIESLSGDGRMAFAAAQMTVRIEYDADQPIG